MEKKRGMFVGAVIAVVISLISLGVAFAAFSSTLTINGSGEIQGSVWDIHFATSEGGNAPTGTGTTINPVTASGEASSTAATLTGSSFTWSGTFRTPGDTLEYRFYVVNKGDYNAILTGTFTSTVSCSINNVAQATCPVTYTVTKDGTTPFANNDTLNKDQSQLIVVKAVLDPNFTGTENPINVSTTQIVFTYNQNVN